MTSCNDVVGYQRYGEPCYSCLYLTSIFRVKKFYMHLDVGC